MEYNFTTDYSVGSVMSGWLNLEYGVNWRDNAPASTEGVRRTYLELHDVGFDLDERIGYAIMAALCSH